MTNGRASGVTDAVAKLTSNQGLCNPSDHKNYKKAWYRVVRIVEIPEAHEVVSTQAHWFDHP